MDERTISLHDYINNVTRLEAAVPEDVNKPVIWRLQHAIMGMAGEVGELIGQVKKHIIYGRDLDLVNLAEETGDFMWYLAVAMDAQKINPEEADSWVRNEIRKAGDTGVYDIETYRKNLYMLLRLVSDLASFMEVDGIDVEEQRNKLFNPCLRTIQMATYSLCDLVDITPGEVRQINVDKLNARYASGGFTSDEATDRDLDNEREVLEGAMASVTLNDFTEDMTNAMAYIDDGLSDVSCKCKKKRTLTIRRSLSISPKAT